MRNFFNSEDFGFEDTAWPSRIADRANKKLNALIESWPVVTGYCDDAGDLWYGNDGSISDTHKARLAFIEEIVKEPKEEIYVDAGIEVNGERLYKKVLK